MDMATGSDFAPLARDGVWVSTVATMIMQMPMPMAPTMSKNLRPKRSAVQAALRVKRISQVALRALISAMVDEDLNTFLYTMVE